MDTHSEVRPIVSCNPASSAGSRLQPGQRTRLYCPIPSSHPLDFLGHCRLYSTANLSAYSGLSFCSGDQTKTTTVEGRGCHYETSSTSTSSAVGSIEGRLQNSPHDTPKVKGNLVRKRKAEYDAMMDYGFPQTRNGAAQKEQRDSTSATGSSARGRFHYPEGLKDETYWKRRRKNNEAAKRSRDARRAREGEMAMRASILEDENLRLRAQVALLTNESHRLYCRLYSGLGLL